MAGPQGARGSHRGEWNDNKAHPSLTVTQEHCEGFDLKFKSLFN